MVMSNFIWINSIQELDEFLQDFDSKDFSFDTEFTSLSWMKQEIIGMSIYDKNTMIDSAYIQFNFSDTYITKEKDPKGGRKKVEVTHQYHKTDAIDFEDARPYLEKLFDGAKCTTANGKVELKIMTKYGITNWKIEDDTMLMSWMLNVDELKGLKYNAKKHLNLDMPSYESTIGQKVGNINWNLVNWYDYAEYGAKDAYATEHLKYHFLPLISEFGALLGCYKGLEIPLIYEVARSEMAGVSIDIPFLNKLSIKAEKEIYISEQKIFDEIGIEFNISSSKQLANILFDRLGLPVIKTSEKTGNRSVDEATLKELSFKGHYIADDILDYRKLKKLKSTYIDSIPKMVDTDGRLRGSFNQAGTACITGDSLVVTSDGLIPIKDCSAETIIINKYLQEEGAEAWVNFRKRPTIKITTNLGFEVEGTHNHQCIVNRYAYKDYLKDSHQWKRLDNMVIGDRIIIPYGYNKFGNPFNSIKYDIPNRKVKTNTKVGTILPITMSTLLAEFIGIYNADGSIKDDNGSFSIRISNRKGEVKSRILYLSKRLFNIEANAYEEETVITSILLKPIATALNLGRKDKYKTIPKQILQGSRDEVIGYLKGLTLDCHVVNELNKSYFDWTITNKKHAYQVHNILINLGIIGSIKKINSFYNICIYNYFGNKFLNLVGSVKKQHSFRNKHKSKNPNFRFSRFRDKCIELPIRRIEHKINDVYDFVLPKTHSFIANSMIQHNTGRFSSSKPNLQNQPNNKDFPIKRAFIPKPGYKFLVYDWSTIEVRIMAHESGDPAMIKIFTGYRDIHQETTDNVNKLIGLNLNRGQGKTINFGVLYLMGAKSLAYMLNKQLRKEVKEGKLTMDEYKQHFVTDSTAQRIIDGYFSTYKGFAKFVKQETAEVKRTGWSWTLGGRRRPVPELNQKKRYGFGVRKAVNSPIQGGAGDLMKLAIIKMQQLFIEEQFDAVTLLYVHDELVIEVREDQADRCSPLVKKVMENIFPESKVPILAEGGIFDDWAGLKQGAKKVVDIEIKKFGVLSVINMLKLNIIK